MSADNISSQPCKKIRLNNTEITILGTAHISKTSAEAVKSLIESNNFDVVAIELCQSRYDSIINPNALANMDLFEVIKNKK